MDEGTAKDRLTWDFGVSRETLGRLDELVDLIRVEATQQNLVSATSLEHIYARHILDSVQLMRFLPAGNGPILDIGSGAGFPGLVFAFLADRPMVLVEPRKLRAAWLERAADMFDLGHVLVHACKIDSVPRFAAAIITARAVASADTLFSMGLDFSTEKSQWILPRGRSAVEELASIRATWHGRFHMEPSITDPDSAIIVASGVAPRSQAKPR